jgi:hypothetical protein
MGHANDPVDVLLTNALLRLRVKGNKNNVFSLGPLRAHALSFPELFETTSLAALGSLCQTSRIGATRSALPGLHVHFGVGRWRERSFFNFFNSVLQFQNKDFLKVLEHGCSIAVIGGAHNEIAAAIIFVPADEGIFIDAIAVANGCGPNMCRLNNASFTAGDTEQEAIVKNSDTGSFQHLGLGTLLLSLIEQVAAQQCADKNPSLFLKTNPDGLECYKNLDFVPLPADTSLPPGLSLVVLEHNYVKSLVDGTVLVSQSVVLDEQPSPPASTVAAAQDEPPPSDDSGSESDPELRAVDPSDLDGKPAAVETDSDAESLAIRRSPRGKRDKSKDVSSSESQSSEKNAQKRMKIEKARVLAVETCEIECSDKSDLEFDFDNYAAVPASGGRWQLPVRDFWLPQNQRNADFRVPPKTPELSHSLTQNETHAKYPATPTPSLPFGRIKILRSALFYQTNAQLKKLQNKPNTFVRQDYVDFACVSDSNRPISVIPKSYAVDTETIQVQVSSYLIPPQVSLKSLVSNQAARRSATRHC